MRANTTDVSSLRMRPVYCSPVGERISTCVFASISDTNESVNFNCFLNTECAAGCISSVDMYESNFLEGAHFKPKHGTIRRIFTFLSCIFVMRIYDIDSKKADIDISNGTLNGHSLTKTFNLCSRTVPAALLGSVRLVSCGDVCADACEWSNVLMVALGGAPVQTAFSF